MKTFLVLLLNGKTEEVRAFKAYCDRTAEFYDMDGDRETLVKSYAEGVWATISVKPDED